MPTRKPAIVVATWLCAVGAGFVTLATHATTAGSVGDVPARLPAEVAHSLGLRAGEPVLLLAAHPACPCLPSTLEALRRSLPADAGVAVHVLAFLPPAATAGWDPEAMARLRHALPQAAVAGDRDAALARRLGAQTSGHVLLYDRDGQLRFSGGVTAGRGHVGDNASARRLAAAVAACRSEARRQPSGDPRAAAAWGKSPVFGCPLVADSPEREEPCCGPGSSSR